MPIVPLQLVPVVRIAIVTVLKGSAKTFIAARGSLAVPRIQAVADRLAAALKRPG